MLISPTSRLRSSAAWQAGKKVKTATERAIFNVARRHILRNRFRLVIIAGQKRSGNHAFINWFLCQSRGPCVFFNHVAPDQYPTERHRREFRLNDRRALATVALSYEDCNIVDIFNGALSTFMSDHTLRITDTQLCLILRDPRNLIASRFRKWPAELTETYLADQVVTQWKSYARTALGHSPRAPVPTVPVYYNAFVTESAYRDRLSSSLNIRTGNRGLDTVSHYGHGSSFDGLSAQQDPKTMDIFGRWRAFENEPRFNRLFVDEDLETLHHSLEAAAGLVETQ